MVVATGRGRVGDRNTYPNLLLWHIRLAPFRPNLLGTGRRPIDRDLPAVLIGSGAEEDARSRRESLHGGPAVDPHCRYVSAFLYCNIFTRLI